MARIFLLLLCLFVTVTANAAVVIDSYRYSSASATPASISYQTSAVNSANLSTYTFTSQAIGTASATRVVIVGVFCSSGGSPVISTVTVGGISATSANTLASSLRTVGVYTAPVPTGTTANIVVTMTGTVDNCGISVWRADNLLSTTPVDSQQIAVVSTTVTYPALATSASGIAVWVVGTNLAASTYTWANATERYDQTIEGVVTQSGADATTTGSSITATATASSGSSLSTGVGASFR